MEETIGKEIMIEEVVIVDQATITHLLIMINLMKEREIKNKMIKEMNDMIEFQALTIIPDLRKATATVVDLLQAINQIATKIVEIAIVKEIETETTEMKEMIEMTEVKAAEIMKEVTEMKEMKELQADSKRVVDLAVVELKGLLVEVEMSLVEMKLEEIQNLHLNLVGLLTEMIELKDLIEVLPQVVQEMLLKVLELKGLLDQDQGQGQVQGLPVLMVEALLLMREVKELKLLMVVIIQEPIIVAEVEVIAAILIQTRNECCDEMNLHIS